MRLLLLILLFAVAADAGFFDFISKLGGGSSGSGSSSSSSRKKDKPPPVDDDKAKKYLQDFGYVGPSNSLNSAPNGMSADLSDAGSIFKRAILKFQEFAGLKRTGNLDEDTKTKMAEPRCGVTDVLAVTSGGAAFKWKKNRLTYSIENFSSDLPRDDVRRAIREAYETWSAVTPLEFEEVQSGGDIKIRFGTRNHNDPWPFDGKSGVLAHATMPESGILHFDDDENWTYGDAKKIASSDYVDILAVAIHEGGHTLGLSHSRDETSIMAPFYQKTVDDRGNYKRPTLKSDDIQSVQDIYGPRTGGRPSSSGGGSFGGGSDFEPPRTQRPPTTTTKSWFGRFFGDDDDTTTRPRITTSRPRFTTESSFGGSSGSSGGSFGGSSGGFGGSGGQCPNSVDAYTPSDDFSYLFSGSSVFQISGTKVYKAHQIRDLFPSAPYSVQAAVFNPVSGMMLLFGNGQVYGYYFSRLRGIFQLDTGYPKKLPNDITFRPNGALRWINGHQILLSGSDDFVVYDEFWNQTTMKNKISSYFPNLPEGIRGIESPSGSMVTAFSSSTVYQYDSRRKQVVQTKSLSSFITC